MTDQEQRVFNGRYELLRHIARGGMAEVYLAHDQLLDRPVALKVLFPELSIDRSFVERFRREAQAAANLSHPNIVSVYDWGEEDGGTYFIVMEYVDGKTLSSLIRSAPLLPDRAAAIGADVAAALAFAHRNGVIHRDVKPGNVLIDNDGQVKVTDFGIARAAGSDEGLTQTGAVMGTATYFSPEQAQGNAVDARSDVYSLGVVLYEMVTGKPPFTGDNPVAIAYKHVREQPTPPRQVNPSIPAAFEAIIAQAMAKDPADRYATAEELRADLLRFHQGRTVLANPPVVEPVTTAVAGGVAGEGTTMMPATTVTTMSREAEPPGPPRRTGAYIVLLLVMLAALAVLLFLLARTVGLVGNTSSTKQVVVPSVLGQKVDDAEKALRDQGLTPKQDPQANDNAPVGTVFDQDPKDGSKVNRGTTVTLKVSSGTAPVNVPLVIGDSIDDATNALQQAGFVVGTPVTKADETRKEGTVLDQDPPANTQVAKGSTVTLTVSSGKAKETVPDVTNQAEADAANTLGQAGFRTKTVREASPSVPAGDVTRTDPPANSQAAKGSVVTLFVSSGPEQGTVPNVVGDLEAQARSALEAAGFKVSSQVQTVFTDSDNGKVLDQSPSAGTQAAKGSTVTITVGKKVGGSSSSTTSSSTTSTTKP